MDVVNWARSGRIEARSGRTGLPLWIFDTGLPAPLVPIDGWWAPRLAIGSLDGDGSPDIAAGSLDGRVLAISGRDGHLLWSFTAGGPVLSSPALADLDADRSDEVLIGSDDGSLYALSGRSGKQLFAAKSGGALRSGAVTVQIDSDRVPDVVFAGHDGLVRAVSGSSGAPLWTCSLGAPVFAPPVAGDLDGDRQEEIVVVAANGQVHALTGGGRKLWSERATTSLTLHRPAVDVVGLSGDGHLEVLAWQWSGSVSILSGADGRVVHRVQTGPLDRSTRAVPFPFDPTGSWKGRVVSWRTFREPPARRPPEACKEPPLLFTLRNGDSLVFSRVRLSRAR